MKILGLSSDGLLGYAAPLGFFSALGGHFLDAGTSLFRAWGTRLRKHVSGGGAKSISVWCYLSLRSSVPEVAATQG